MPPRPWTSASQLAWTPRPRGDTIPSPVITTLRPISSPGRRAPVSGVALDVAHRVADRVNLLGVLVADLDLERLLERHHQLDGVERVGPQVVDERRLHRHFLGVHTELFDDDRFDLVFDALRHRSSSGLPPGPRRPAPSKGRGGPPGRPIIGPSPSHVKTAADVENLTRDVGPPGAEQERHAG